MSPEEIAASCNESKKVTRADIQSAIDCYDDPTNNYTNIQTWLESITCLTPNQKEMILYDLESYAD